MENTAYITTFTCFLGLFFLLLILSITASTRIVRENRRLSIYRLGRYVGDKGPGIVFLLPFIDKGVLKELRGAEQTPSRKLVGAIGETRTTVFTGGKVSLASEEWDATSQTPIAAGQRVRVVKMILEVEAE